jgi:hypothetical protein
MPNQTGHLDTTKADDNAGSIGTIPIRTTQAIITCEDNAIRWRADGTAPTAAVGTLMNVGDVLTLAGNDYNAFLNRFSFINAVAGANGNLQAALLDGFDRA